MHKYGKWLIIISTIAVVIILSIIFAENFTADDIVNNSPHSIPLSILALLALYVIKSVVMIIPMPLLFISAGMMFPKGWAIVISYFCMAIELTIDWWLGRKMGTDKVVSWVKSKPKMASILARYQENTHFTCLLSRLIPWQSEPFSIFFGAAKMPYLTYMVISLFGLSIQMIPFILAGSAINDPLSKEFLIPLVICVVVTILIIIFARKLNQRHKKVTSAIPIETLVSADKKNSSPNKQADLQDKE